MPSAEVVGAYQLSLSGDASLLTEARSLSLSSVVAIGFGDIAQLEYRRSEAVTEQIGLEDEDKAFGLPTLGVQLKVPYRASGWVPATAVALRFGFPQSAEAPDGLATHEQNVTDFYVVGRIEPHRRLRLHGGLRVSVAKIDSEGVNAPADFKKTVLLPAGGWEFVSSKSSVLVGELALVPVFKPGDSATLSEVSSGIFGRFGVRWRLLPYVVFDASVGYRIEVQRIDSNMSDMPNAFVDWDIRLGGEIFVPWGRLACRGLGALCK
jgi:hypothetical protein